jgi:hypothetical protein
MYLFSRMRPLDATIQLTVYARAMRSSRICIAACRAPRRAAPPARARSRGLCCCRAGGCGAHTTGALGECAGARVRHERSRANVRSHAPRWRSPEPARRRRALLLPPTPPAPAGVRARGRLSRAARGAHLSNESVARLNPPRAVPASSAPRPRAAAPCLAAAWGGTSCRGVCTQSGGGSATRGGDFSLPAGGGSVPALVRPSLPPRPAAPQKFNAALLLACRVGRAELALCALRPHGARRLRA